MMELEALRVGVVRPALHVLQLWSPALECLVVGTALARSALPPDDGGRGPWGLTLGLSNATLAGLARRDVELLARLEALLAPLPHLAAQLAGNASYGAGVVAAHYWLSGPLPERVDAHELTACWSARWATPWPARFAAPAFAAACMMHEGEAAAA